jgi:predicted lipid-binding transport protein (Tim44 family)
MLARVDLSLKVLALGTALVPLAGAAQRWVWFAVGGVVPPQLAWHLPLTDLAGAGGIYALILGVQFGAIVLFLRILAPLEFTARVVKKRIAAVDTDERGTLANAITRRATERLAKLEDIKQRAEAPGATQEGLEAIRAELQQVQLEQDRDNLIGEQFVAENKAAIDELRAINKDLDAAFNALPRWLRSVPRFPRWVLYLTL